MAERLIRESDVIKLIDEWLDNYPLPRHVEKGLASHEELLAYIADAPTIEAKPVVHAHWEGSRCSNCKRNLFELFDAGSHLIENFKEEVVCCPYCGATMDEGVKIPVISMEDVPKIMEEMEK